MARLTRKNIKVFAGEATDNGVFGSLQANNPTLTNDVEQIQSLSAWSEGWNSATETSEELPPLEEFQGVQYVTTYQQAYIMQEGMPEWAATVTYYKGSLVKKVTTTGFQIYNSLTDNNINNQLSDTENWKKVMDSDDLYAFDNSVVHLAGSETITGEKTFSVSPLVPTATSGDSSTKAASTEFVSAVSSDLQTQINAKAADNAVVKLTGDQTITGLKTFTSNVQIQSADGTQNPYLMFHVPGVRYTRLIETSSGLEVQDGGGSSLDRLYAGASDVVNTVVTTVAKSKGNIGYFQLGNGLIINWGTLSSGKTITFSRAFTNADSYALVFNNNATTDGYGRGDKIESKSSTSATVNGLCENPIRWLAIGY